MTAVNKSPWVKNLYGATQPLIRPMLAQAGSTQAIKAGEICVYNETSGYIVPANAVADNVYSLVVAAEEQTATDSARYIECYMPREGDVFEFALSTAAQVALGDALTLVASESQQLTRDVDGAVAAVCVGEDNYPDTGTTLTSKSYVEAMIHPEYSYWTKNVVQKGLVKVLAKTAAYTLKLEDCGAILTNKGATGTVAITAPESVVPVGWNIKIAAMAAQVISFDPKPDTASVYVKGAAHTAGAIISVTDEGDFVHLVWDGTDWLSYASISGADGDITLG